MLNASKEHESNQSLHQGFPEIHKKGCSMDKIFRRTGWAMLGSAESAYTNLSNGNEELDPPFFGVSRERTQVQIVASWT